MRADLTAAAARALEIARSLALDEGCGAVRPVHVAHGLLAEEEGRAGVLAGASGLDWIAYRRAAPPSLPAAPVPRESIDLDAQTQAVLSMAQVLAMEMAGETEVPGEMLLLALLRTDVALRNDLAALGLQADRLEAAVHANRAPPLQMDEPLHLDEPIERIDLSRVLDACANRAREGLRVAEDYCRFVLDDAILCGELKNMRHELTAVLTGFVPDLLAARDTENDVGAPLSTAGEQRRHSLVDVAQTNLKRLQEALRSLEEFGKICGPRVGQRLERLRYRSYTLEKAIVGGTEARDRLASARLHVLLTGANCKASLEWIIGAAAAGGADIIQLREKTLADRDLLARARDVRRWTRRAGVLFIVNDRPDIARVVEADGVHLGQDDLPVREARRILGPDALIGVSTHDMQQLRGAILDGASYIGVGPAFPSATKKFSDLAGTEYVREATAATTLPAFVIGGINLRTIGTAVAAGARRIAVSHAVADADDPRAVTAALRQALP